MDWAKVDAPLASALAGAEADEPLAVFVRLDRPGADEALLARFGLDQDGGLDRDGDPDRDGTEIITASLTASQLAVLTDQRWVRRVSLSGRLRLREES